MAVRAVRVRVLTLPGWRVVGHIMLMRVRQVAVQRPVVLVLRGVVVRVAVRVVAPLAELLLVDYLLLGLMAAHNLLPARY